MKHTFSHPRAFTLWGATFSLIAASALPAMAQTSGLRPVALTGTDGPLGPGLGPGVFFSEFSTPSEPSATPAINRLGDSVFNAKLVGTGIHSTNDAGIWAERGGHLVLLARTGDQAPGTPPGVTFKAFQRLPIIGASGKVALLAVVTGPGIDNNNNDGLWSEGSGTLDLLLRERTTPVPGHATSQFGDINHPNDPSPTMWFGLPAINAGGHVLMGVLLTDAGGMYGEYTDRSGTLEEAWRKGDPVPGLAPRIFAGTGAYPAFNDAGQIAFWGITSTPFPQFTGFWSDRQGSIASVALSGDPAPGAGFAFGSLGFIPAFNLSGQMAFGAMLADANGTPGVWSEGLFGVIQPIGIAGNLAPGTTSTFFSFDEPVLSDSGATAFAGTINVLNANRGVWSNHSGILELIAGSGVPLPGVPGATFNDFFSLAINASGEVSFFATASTGKALCRQAPDGSLSTVLSEFTLLDVLGDGSDIRLITNVFKPTPIYAGEPLAGGTGDGRRVAFSDGGDVVSRLAFSDGSEGIVTTRPLVNSTGTPFCFGTSGSCPCGNPGSGGHGCANSTFGLGALLTANGNASLANDSLVFHVADSVPNTFGLLFQGNTSAGGGNGIPFGNGLMCAGGHIVRLELLLSDSNGSVSSTMSISTQGNVNTGETKRYQWWYRDPSFSSCLSGFNTSNGLGVTWN